MKIYFSWHSSSYLAGHETFVVEYRWLWGGIIVQSVGVTRAIDSGPLQKRYIYIYILVLNLQAKRFRPVEFLRREKQTVNIIIYYNARCMFRLPLRRAGRVAGS